MAELNGSPASPEAIESLGLVNYGHFTSMRVDDGRVRGLSRHMDRLVDDCRALFDVELDRDRLRKFVRSAIASTRDSFVLRATVFDPTAELSHPGAAVEPSVLITTRPAVSWPPTPMRVQSTVYRRDMPEVKHIGLFGALAGRRRAQLNGYDDALFLDSASFVLEGATWNIGFVEDGRVIWPSGRILPGVTMRLLKQVHDHSVSRALHLGDVQRMEAAFATNTAVGVRPITAIDDIEFRADHPALDELRREYTEIPGERP